MTLKMAATTLRNYINPIGNPDTYVCTYIHSDRCENAKICFICLLASKHIMYTWRYFYICIIFM